MFDIPLKIVFIDPIYDLFILIFLVYIFLSSFYRKLLKINFEDIFWIDIKVNFIFLFLSYINYYSLKFDFFGFKIDWWLWLMIVQILIQIFFVFLYWDDVQEYLKKSKIKTEEKKILSLKNKIIRTELFKEFLEEELGEIETKMKLEKGGKKNKDYKMKINSLKKDIKETKREIKAIKKELSEKEKKSK